ncbi:MAG: DUF4263 domain-containing protein [Nanoarchaeota archaeon]|nr:DUF4263 domain-containing protein [Nanoarchaeota archaeon]
MELTLEKRKGNLILIIESEFTIDWIKKYIDDNNFVSEKIFHLKSNNLISFNDNKRKEYSEDLEKNSKVEFKIGELDNDKEYFKILENILLQKNNIYIHKSININLDLFLIKRTPKIKINFLNKIDKLVQEDIYIGGNNINMIPIEVLFRIKKEIPNYYEIQKYVDSKITPILSDYLESTVEGVEKFQNYLNKKNTYKGKFIFDEFKEYELVKYKKILNKLENMLSEKNIIAEKIWQKEIFDILLLLYPKYIVLLENVNIKADSNKNRYLDFVLVDNNGNLDIIEIKSPKLNHIISEKPTYRKNYIPKRDLIGTIMQLEKYIYYLKRWGEIGEKKLTENYKKNRKIPQDLDLNVVNPNGIIVMGQEKDLNVEQIKDFEIIKRKYKNIVDIITYDDLIRRLKNLISNLEKK